MIKNNFCLTPLIIERSLKQPIFKYIRHAVIIFPQPILIAYKNAQAHAPAQTFQYEFSNKKINVMSQVSSTSDNSHPVQQKQ